MARMKKAFFPLAVTLLALGAARAQTVELGFSYGTHPFSVNLALQNFVLLEQPELSLEAAVSNTRVQAGATLGTDFATIGRVSATARFGVAYVGGVRFEAGVRGAIGPVSLEVAGAAWSAPVTVFDWAAPYAFNPEPLSNGGGYFGGAGTYRVSRTVFATLGARWGTDQSRLSLRVENRTGVWTYGGGPLLAWQSNGLTYGVNALVRWSPESLPLNLETQTFVGVNEAVGFGFGGAALNLSYTLEELGTLNAFVNYEIWRLDVLPFRTGVRADVNLGPGVLIVQGYGGADLNWTWSGGARIAYRLDLGALLNP
jgi:hypothetical protein